MSLRYSDLHLQILTRGLLDPGEQLTGHVATLRSPWYGFGLLTKQFLLVATDRRLLVVEHTKSWIYRAFVISRVESVPWSNVEELALRGLIAKTKLRLVARTSRGTEKLSMKIPGMFAPIRDNGRAGRAVVATFQAQRALPPGSSPPQLVAQYGG